MRNFPTVPRPLRDLVCEFSRGEIPLPQFQRPFVWKPSKIRNLLDSLLRGFPIGGFYLWRPNVDKQLDERPKAFGEQRRVEATFEGYLIDGQQRLTSLEVAFELFTGEDENAQELRCFLDLAASDEERRQVSRLFVTYGGNRSIARRVDNMDPTLVPLKRLLDEPVYRLRDEIRAALQERDGWDPKRIEGALQRLEVACDMLNQQVPCTTVSGVEDDVAIEVFGRLNKGTPLPQTDVRAAELARDAGSLEVLKRMRNFVGQDRPRRLGFGFSFAFRALVVFHRGRSQLINLRPNWVKKEGPEGRSLADSWDAAEKAIDTALEFAERNMGWSRRALLPSANALIVLAAAFDKADRKLGSDTEQQLYRQWLCLTALRGVFRGSVETTIDRFVRAIRESRKRPAKALVEALRRAERDRVRPEEFLTWGQPWGPATQVMHAYFVSQEAKDWLTGDLLDNLARRGDADRTLSELTVHHLFARNLLKELVENPDDVNRPANFALLSGPTNAKFSDLRPEDVWSDLSPDERKRAAVQFFGDAAGDHLRPDRYDEFCQWRAKRLAESINEWLGN
jgi:hypothetical protein